ncbi:hypothetical protein ACFWXA_13905 [Streptomyces atroolivaceus]|uniref:DUF7168 domain-containing protein n=1 Tax=Streptomyces atroolivaceus TaxID=66869 RepID=UPI00364F2331
MAKYGIEQAMLGDDVTESERPVDRIVDLYPPYVKEGRRLLARIGYEMRCRSVYPGGKDNRHRVHLFGFETDLQATEVLFASLRLQMLEGADRLHRPAGEDARAYKRSWMLGFIREVTVRISAAQRTASAAAEEDSEAEGTSSRSVALVLADRTTVVEARLSDQCSPRLIDGGKILLAHVRRWDEPDSGETLALIDAASGQITSSVKRPESLAALDPAAKNSLTVNDAGTLVADVVGRNKILIRQIPSLRKVAEITTLMPPVDERGIGDPMTLTFFRSGDELLTLSGSRIEHWNARSGSRLSETIDARDLELGVGRPVRSHSPEGAPGPEFALNSPPHAGHAQITVYGDPVLYTIDLGTGEEDKARRVRLGRDVETAILDTSGRYAAAKTPGGMLELWSAATGRRPSRMVGPLGPLGSNDRFTGDGFTFSFTGRDGEFYVANGSSVRFQQLSDSSSFETYDFAANQYFVAATEDGKTLLRTLSGGGFGGGNGDRGRLDLIHLDPGLWKHHLCDVVGHDLTRDERLGLPSGLPEVICPA